MKVNAFGKVLFKTVGKTQTIVFINHNLYGYPSVTLKFLSDCHWLSVKKNSC